MPFVRMHNRSLAFFRMRPCSPKLRCAGPSTPASWSKAVRINEARSSDVMPRYQALFTVAICGNTRKLLRFSIFLIASSSLIISPFAWLAWSSRFRILTVRLSFSCAPTTKMKLYCCSCPVRIFFCMVFPLMSLSACIPLSRNIFCTSST